jgi:hypothetical protein
MICRCALSRLDARTEREHTLSTQDEIKKAIGAHGQWKSRLLAAVNSGTSDFTVAQVSADNNCEFGKWLYNGIDVGAKKSPHYEEVRKMHAQFHTAAGKVLGSALAGHGAEAKASIENSAGDYSKASGDLTRGMMAWMGDT